MLFSELRRGKVSRPPVPVRITQYFGWEYNVPRTVTPQETRDTGAKNTGHILFASWLVPYARSKLCLYAPHHQTAPQISNSANHCDATQQMSYFSECDFWCRDDNPVPPQDILPAGSGSWWGSCGQVSWAMPHFVRRILVCFFVFFNLCLFPIDWLTFESDFWSIETCLRWGGEKKTGIKLSSQRFWNHQLLSSFQAVFTVSLVCVCALTTYALTR